MFVKPELGQNIKKDVCQNASTEDIICAPVTTRQSESQKNTENKEKNKEKISPTLLSNMSPQTLREEQLKDPTLTKVREWTKNKETTGKKYRWKKGILHRVFTDNDTTFTQVVVPQKYRDEVMKIGHDTPMAGHMRVRGTLNRIWRNFHWPGIQSDVRRYCAACDLCQRSMPTPEGDTTQRTLGTCRMFDRRAWSHVTCGSC